jgi:hypothetical protein
MWHAHEYLAFFLYYALPVFFNIMPFEHYQNLKKIIIFLEVILSKNISMSKLELAKKIITEFVQELQFLYPMSIYVSGVHELLHLVDCTIHHGALNSTNCFQFEELNRKVSGFFNGPDLIGEEFIKIFTTAQALNIIATNCKNEKLRKFFEEHEPFKSSNKKCRTDKSIIKTLGKCETNSNPLFLNLYEHFFGKKTESLNVFKRINFHGIIYESFENKSKRCDACFHVKENKKEKLIGLLDRFFFYENNLYAFAKKIVSLHNPFYCETYPDLKSHLRICSVSSEYFIQPIETIQKSVFVQINQNQTYVSTFSTSHLFS